MQRIECPDRCADRKAPSRPERPGFAVSGLSAVMLSDGRRQAGADATPGPNNVRELPGKPGGRMRGAGIACDIL